MTFILALGWTCLNLLWTYLNLLKPLVQLWKWTCVYLVEMVMLIKWVNLVAGSCLQQAW
jgi:hypothetical protein